MYRPGLAQAVERWVKTGLEILGFLIQTTRFQSSLGY